MASSFEGVSYQSISPQESNSHQQNTHEESELLISRQDFIDIHAEEQQNFTLRGIVVGLIVGSATCFSNMYFGLQTGWISPMSMPSALMGFAIFKSVSRQLELPFTPVENVLIQSVAGGMGTMPLGCGLVGVMPVLNYMLTPAERGPIILSLWKLILWSLGLCFFGVIFAVPLRKQVIIRENLKFPSGTATAMMIEVLHGKETVAEYQTGRSLGAQDVLELNNNYFTGPNGSSTHRKSNWRVKGKILAITFTLSAMYTIIAYFFPILRDLPVFGSTLASVWLWTFNPSLAYIGQGIIMGPASTLHMLLGAVVGWGILSPLAKHHGWAPGLVGDWNSGSKGWIVWVSLAIMLADSIISLSYIALLPILKIGCDQLANIRKNMNQLNWKGFLGINTHSNDAELYSPIMGENISDSQEIPPVDSKPSEPEASPEHCVGNSTVCVTGILSILFCVASIRIVFGPLIPIYATFLAILMALGLSVMGVRALGETDLNPVSGISKIAQLIFALIIPRTNENSILINLVAGAISEAGALQAGDLLQDLKTGHLLGAAPKAQFWGQIIGSGFGAVMSALIYKLYTNVYLIPGDLFQVPTAYVWIYTARLVTGHGLPPMAWEWSSAAAVLFSGFTILRILNKSKSWHPYVPSGIAFAVGIYNVPSFTLARAVGGIFGWYLRSYRRKDESVVVILASGLILGEGVFSIFNLILASAKVPHL